MIKCSDVCMGIDEDNFTIDCFMIEKNDKQLELTFDECKELMNILSSYMISKNKEKELRRQMLNPISKSIYNSEHKIDITV